MADKDDWRSELSAEGAVFGQCGMLEGLLHFGRPEAEYAALVGSAAIADLDGWSWISVTGGDRATFLHNMCTNEVRKLPAGSGCEAFFLNAKGHVLGHGFLFANKAEHVLFGSPGQRQRLVAHLDRYIIREDVQLTDRSEEFGQLLLGGPACAALLKRVTGAEPPSEALAGSDPRIGGAGVSARAVPITGPHGFLLTCPAGKRRAVWSALVDAGAHVAGLQAVEMARVEFGFPIYGRDLGEQNLPQEANRDDRAISFVKGCYIGQETVARIDALGHVNRKLVGIRFEVDCPPTPPVTLAAAGQPVGEVTSAVFSPRLAAALALAYVRRGHDEPGTRLDSPVGPAHVVKLPIE